MCARVKFQPPGVSIGMTPLSYMGVRPTTPPNIQEYDNSDPTPQNCADFEIGDLWINVIPQGTAPQTYKYRVWILVNKVGSLATWILFTSGGGPVTTLSGNIGTNPVFPDINGNINVFGDGIGINISGDGVNTLTASLTGAVATSYVTSSPVPVPTGVGGTAVPIAGILNVQGSHNMSLSGGLPNTGAGNDVVVWMNNAITLGDLVALGPHVPAVTAATGDITITAGNLNLPNTDAAGTEGIITVNGRDFMSSFGVGNTFLGKDSGVTSGSGTSNTGIGTQATSALTTGHDNTGIGYFALANCQTGINNAALGAAALLNVTTGSFNTGVGVSSAQFITTGVNNTAIGYGSLNNIAGPTTSSNVIAIGFGAGSLYATNESQNIVIGHFGVVGDNQVIRIGNAAGGSSTQNKCFIAGIVGITTGVNDAIPVLIDSAGQLGTVSSSAKVKENIRNMENVSARIHCLQPVIFNYKGRRPNDISFGLIAEDVEKVFPELVVHDSSGQPTTVKYLDFIPLMLNEIQRLSNKIKSLEDRLDKSQ